MRIIKSLILLTIFSISCSANVSAQNKLAVVPLDDDLMVPIVTESGPPEFLDEFFDKPIIFNKGWDQRIGHRTRHDPTVNIEFKRLEPVFGFPGIIYTANEIRQWGEQRFFRSPKRIFATGVLLVDKGNALEGGRFEWSLNQQGFMSFHNIVRRDVRGGWIGAWTDPRPGDTVHFFIMSDDERFSSNPITFTWP